MAPEKGTSARSTNDKVNNWNYPLEILLYYRIQPVVNSYLFLGLPRVTMPDERFEYLCGAFKPVSKVPAYLEVRFYNVWSSL